MKSTPARIICFVCTLFLSSLYAEQAAPSASYKKTFEKFLEISQSNAMLKDISDGKAAEQIIAQITKGQDITKAQKDKVTRIVRGTLSNVAQELGDKMLLLYHKYYTEQDLNDLIALYQTPAGKKLANNAVATLRDSQELAQAMVIQYFPKMESQIHQILAESKK